MHLDLALQGFIARVFILHDCRTRRIGRPYRDAQDSLLWKDKTCPARTWLIMSWKALKLLRSYFSSKQHVATALW